MRAIAILSIFILVSSCQSSKQNGIILPSLEKQSLYPTLFNAEAHNGWCLWKPTPAEKERSQRWLARKLGISANAMNAICQQKAQPLERFFEIAEILGVPVTALINLDYEPRKKPKEPGSIS
jgi:DNA-binding XRE family transcriptional regulator